MEEFTKGPWFVAGRKPLIFVQGKVCVDGDDGLPVVVADTNPYFSESKANAALIAAAPEMYEMLKLILSVYEMDYDDTDKALKLLAKARGEQ